MDPLCTFTILLILPKQEIEGCLFRTFYILGHLQAFNCRICGELCFGCNPNGQASQCHFYLQGIITLFFLAVTKYKIYH